MKKTTIFVYGTLRQNFGNHGFLNQSTFKGKAVTLEKFTMFCSGQIPFLSRSQAVSTIVGEVYEVDDETLRNLDALEGCRPKAGPNGGFETSSWYTREQITVQYTENFLTPTSTMDTDLTVTADASAKNSIQRVNNQQGSTESVWIYLNEKETQHAIIPTGDFADRNRFIISNNRKWYFAYGSNMNLDQMLDRKAYFTRRIKAWVGGYRLVFNKIASNEPGYGKANIVADSSFDVMGILYEVQESDLSMLDRFEGVVGNHYERKEMQVQTKEFGEVTAVVYLAHPSKIQNGLLPTDVYAANFYAGLDILGEEGKSYLDDSIRLARVTDNPKFLLEEDIPFPDKEEMQNSMAEHFSNPQSKPHSNHDNSEHPGDIVIEGYQEEFDLDEEKHQQKLQLERMKKLALPVLIDGFSAKILMSSNGWSDKIVLFCEPECRDHLAKFGLNCDEYGVFRTGKFRILRRGILELVYKRISIEKC